MTNARGNGPGAFPTELRYRPARFAPGTPPKGAPQDDLFAEPRTEVEGAPRPHITRPIPVVMREPAPPRMPAATPPVAFSPVPAPRPGAAGGHPPTLAPPLPPAPEVAPKRPRSSEVGVAARLLLPLSPDGPAAPAGTRPLVEGAAARGALPAAGTGARAGLRLPLAPAPAEPGLRPAPGARAQGFGDLATIPESVWSGSSSIFDGTTFERTPFPAEAVPPPGLVQEDAPLDRDAAERGLLAAIAAGDETSRLIYADWLEDRGEQARASYLRIEQLLSRLGADDPRYGACARQLRELARHVDADWRARVARPPVEGCSSATPRCPRRWDALTRTDREAVRRCGHCAKQVFYFETVDEAREVARRGAPVAIDLGAARWENDLADAGVRCAGCARRVVSTARYCPHCGDTMRGPEDPEEVRVIEVDD